MKIAGLTARPKHATKTSASGATAADTLAATPDEGWSILKVMHKYNGGTPGTKTLTIAGTIEGTAVSIVIGRAHTVNVTEEHDFEDDELVFDENTAVTITGEALTSQTNTWDVLYR